MSDVLLPFVPLSFKPAGLSLAVRDTFNVSWGRETMICFCAMN
jgi:hypothetical protein